MRSDWRRTCLRRLMALTEPALRVNCLAISRPRVSRMSFSLSSHTRSNSSYAFGYASNFQMGSLFKPSGTCPSHSSYLILISNL